MFKKIVISLLFLMTFLLASEAKFIARDATFDGKKMGEVSYRGQEVMRLLSKASYPSAYARAQDVASKLNENIKSIQDLKKIVYRYPNDIYTAYVDNNKIFSIYSEEINFNGSTPEGLMSDWINNIRREMMSGAKPKVTVPPVQEKATPVATEKSNIKVKIKDIKGASSEPKVEASVEAVSPATASETSAESTSNKETVIKADKTADVNFMEIEALKDKVKKMEAQLSRQPKASGTIIVYIIVAISLVLIIFLIIRYMQVIKQIDSLRKIEKTDQLEELENSVSSLMKELQETSNNLTEKAKGILSELENKMKEAKNFSPSSVAASDRSVSPSPEVPAPAVEPVSVEPAVPEVEVQEVAPEPSPAPQVEEPAVVPVAEVPVVEQPAAPAAPAVEEKPIAEQLAEEIDKQKEMESGEKKVDLGDIDDDLREEVERILYNKEYTRNDKVMELASVNVMQEEIAKYLEMGVGEVELILQLSK